MVSSTIVAMLLQATAPTVAAKPSPVAIPTDMAPPDTTRMKLSEVKTFNAKITPDHPYYIKCRSVTVTGSLAKKGRICRTKLEWSQLGEDGNAHARAIVDHSATRMSGQ